MYFNVDQDQQQIMEESQQALQNIREVKKNNNSSLFDEIRENWSRFDRGRQFFDEYDQATFEGKAKVDMMLYDQLFQKLNEDAIQQVEKSISELYKTINEIYEFINVKPEIYGNVDTNILSESVETAHKQLSDVVYTFLENHFYKYSPEERKEKYLDHSREYIKEIITEHNAEPKEAIEHGVKTVIMEKFLTNISFPTGIMNRVNYLLENEDYGAVFDVDTLYEKVESFRKQVHNLARVTAFCI